MDLSQQQTFSDLTQPILIFQVLEGLRRGLCSFMGPSRVAALFASHDGDPILVFDPSQLLKEHALELKDYYLSSDQWRKQKSFSGTKGEVFNFRGPDIPGLISWGRLSSEVFYQMWFTSRPPTLCSPGPIESWLAKASLILAHELKVGTSVFTSSALHALESYGVYAVGEHLISQLRLLGQSEAGLRVEEIPKLVASISTTYEEGKRATGTLAFLSPRSVSTISQLVTFPAQSRPLLTNHKHVRKLLTLVEGTNRYLVSDGSTIIGVGSGELPEWAILARFRAGHGEMLLGSRQICTFRDGNLSGLGRTPQLNDLKTVLARRSRDITSRAKLKQAIAKLILYAWDHNHGCTIIVDFGQPIKSIPGQILSQPIHVTENVDLIEGMSRVDGALHIDCEGMLHAFACLLDGRAILGEDRARGARYNSALRFTADNPNVLAIVVSADGPVSILEAGKQINLPPVWSSQEQIYMEPPTLQSWLSAQVPLAKQP